MLLRDIKINNLIKSALLGMFSALVLGKILANINYDLYCLTSGLAFILIIITYNIVKNFSFYIYLSAFFISNLITYFNIITCSSDEYHFGIIVIVTVIYLISSAFLIGNILFYENHRPKNNGGLYPERQADKNTIIEYLHSFSVFGINSDWGSGKTFLMNNICSELVDEFHFIKINTAAYNADDVTAVIINEIDLLLREQGILSVYSSTIKNLGKTDSSISFVSSLFFDEQNSNAKRIYGFGNELYKLDKEIVIVFEDIDRIDDKKVITKIFSIVNSIVNYSNKIKIVYEYRQDKLISLFNNDTAFVEKYIPYTINLTHITFKTIINRVYNANANILNKIYPDWFYFLCEDANFNCGREKKNIAFLYNIVEGYFRNNYTARNIFNFMLEVNCFFKNNQNINFEKFGQQRNTIILYFFIKHYYKDAYANFSKHWNDIFDIFKAECILNNSTAEINVYNFYKEFLNENSNKVDISTNRRKILENRDFLKSLSFIDCIGINLDVNYEQFKSYSEKNSNIVTSIISIDPAIYKIKHSNDKVIAILKHLHESGFILKTREEVLADKVIDFLKSNDLKISYERYKEFNIYCRSEKYLLENQKEAFESPFTDTINEMFIALYISGIHDDIILQFLNFYQNSYLEYRIDKYMFGTPFISRLNYININNDAVFWKALEIFCNVIIPEKFPFDNRVMTYFTRIYFQRIIRLLNIKNSEASEMFAYNFEYNNFTSLEEIYIDFYPKVKNILTINKKLSPYEKELLNSFFVQYGKMLENINKQIDL